MHERLLPALLSPTRCAPPQSRSLVGQNTHAAPFKVRADFWQA